VVSARVPHGRFEPCVAFLTGRSHDKGIDAVFVDDKARRVYVVQGKYRTELMKKAEKRADLLAFADLGAVLHGDNAEFKSFAQTLDPYAEGKVTEARERLRRRSYALDLHYVTLGRCSGPLEQDARAVARRASGTRLLIIDGRRTIQVLNDYLDGVAPPIPEVDLPVEAGGRGHASGEVQRFDARTQIEAWIFSTNGFAIGELFRRHGVRLFARNVRGFLGNRASIRRCGGRWLMSPSTFGTTTMGSRLCATRPACKANVANGS
jgi:hypothetical protein